MFLDLPDPDPQVRGMDQDPDPDPSIVMQNSNKNIDSYYFVSLFWLFVFEKWCKCIFKK